MSPKNNKTLTKIDALIQLAHSEIEKHEDDDDYWGTPEDINTSNSFFERISELVGFDIAEDDKWGTYLIKATTTEAYRFSIKQLTEIKEALSK